jgi:hypothetical protein
MRRRLAGALTMALATARRPELATIAETARHVSEATIVVGAPPREVYRTLTDYLRWPVLLSDVASIYVERGGRDHARVRVRSRLFGRELAIVFASLPGLGLRGLVGSRRARADARFTIEPIDAGARSLLTASLYLEAIGIARWCVPETHIRELRRAKLRLDLGDLAGYLARRRGGIGPRDA